MPKRSGRPNWLAIRTDWVAGMTLAQLAAKHRVTDRAIRMQKAADAKSGATWIRGGSGAEVPPEVSTPPSLDAGKTKTEDARSALAAMRGRKPDGPKPPSTDYAPADVTDEQLAIALRATAMRALADLDAGLIHPGMNQSYADVVKNVVSAAAAAIQASRDVAGRRTGESSSESEVDYSEGSDSIGVIFEHRVIEAPRDSAAS